LHDPDKLQILSGEDSVVLIKRNAERDVPPGVLKILVFTTHHSPITNH